MSAELENRLKELQAQGENLDIDDAITFFVDIRTYLEKGLIRTAEKVNGEWKVNHWVKEAIIFGFRVGTLEDPGACPPDVHIYTSTRQDWVVLPEGARSFEGYYDPRQEWSEEGKARWKAAKAKAEG